MSVIFGNINVFQTLIVENLHFYIDIGVPIKSTVVSMPCYKLAQGFLYLKNTPMYCADTWVLNMKTITTKLVNTWLFGPVAGFGCVQKGE